MVQTFFERSFAIDRLQAGVDRSVVALWLGHESVETTQIYLDANLAIKEDALRKTLHARRSLGTPHEGPSAPFSTFFPSCCATDLSRAVSAAVATNEPRFFAAQAM